VRCFVHVAVSFTDELRDSSVRNKESLLLSMQQAVSESVMPHGRRPQFTQRPPLEITVTEGDPLTMRCVVEGLPKPIGKATFLCQGLKLYHVYH